MVEDVLLAGRVHGFLPGLPDKYELEESLLPSKVVELGLA